MTEQEFYNLSVDDRVILHGEIDGREFEYAVGTVKACDGDPDDPDDTYTLYIKLDNEDEVRGWWVCFYEHDCITAVPKPKKGLSAFLERTT